MQDEKAAMAPKMPPTVAIRPLTQKSSILVRVGAIASLMPLPIIPPMPSSIPPLVNHTEGRAQTNRGGRRFAAEVRTANASRPRGLDCQANWRQHRRCRINAL